MPKYGYEAEWERLTPKKAYAWLETMGESNRDVKQADIDVYAAQMRAGLWRRTPEPIIFDKNGRMVDGQHRCWAVIEAQTEIEVFVVKGMNPEDVIALNHGRARSYADVAHYAGWDTRPNTGAIAKYMVLQIGVTNQQIPAEVLQRWYKAYKPSIDFAIELQESNRPSQGKKITVPMAAAFARAHASGGDAALLGRMGEILKHGQLTVQADKAALALRDAWLTKRIGTTASDQYLKTEAAIRAFLDRRPLGTLQRPAGELFAIKALPYADRYVTTRTANSPRAGLKARRRFEATISDEARAA